MTIYKQNYQKDRTGFTLIELLVVIAIIGLLASIVLASLSSARSKSRDGRRVADLKEIENAIHLYVTYNNGVAPAALSNLTGSTACGSVSCMPAIPVDPSGGTAAYGYLQQAGGGYLLAAILENAGQTSLLVNDYDGSGYTGTLSINGANHPCNENAGAANEVVYCLYSK